MEDEMIIELFRNRNETALSELSKKYGRHFSGIAERIVCNHEDALECVNEAYLRTWNSIPPARPNVLKAFVGKLVKCAAVSMLRAGNAQKRGGSEIAAVLDELEECVSDGGSIENEFENKQIISLINKFLWKCGDFPRRVFVLRYWHCESVSDIARRFGVTENRVSVSLHRTRESLKDYLAKEGYIL